MLRLYSCWFACNLQSVVCEQLFGILQAIQAKKLPSSAASSSSASQFVWGFNI